MPPTLASSFALALHAALAMELARLLTDDAAFERLWQRPRRTGLGLATRTLALATVTAVRARKR